MTTPVPSFDQMQKIATDLSAVRDRATSLERWTGAFEHPSQGTTGQHLEHDGDGTASWQSRRYCRVYNDTGGTVVSITPAGTWVSVPFTDTSYDPFSLHDTGDNTKIQLNKAGAWLVGYGILWLASAGYTPDGFAQGRIIKNGDTTAYYGFDLWRYESTAGTDQPYNQATDMIESDGNDYVEVQANSSAVASTIVGSASNTAFNRFWAVWLGPTS